MTYVTDLTPLAVAFAGIALGYAVMVSAGVPFSLKNFLFWCGAVGLAAGLAAEGLGVEDGPGMIELVGVMSLAGAVVLHLSEKKRGGAG